MFLDYFYENEVEEYSYINIPRVLMTKAAYRNLSSDAKVIYGMLLDRLALAVKYDWIDDEGQAYIIYLQEELQRDMNMSKRKVIETLQELESIGLIERIQRGARQADVIYLKKFFAGEVSKVNF